MVYRKILKIKMNFTSVAIPFLQSVKVMLVCHPVTLLSVSVLSGISVL